MINQNSKVRRKIRVRSKLNVVKDQPRISVYRSNRYFYAQVINDEKGNVLATSSSFEVSKKTKQKVKKSEEAKIVGLELAKKMIKKGIKRGVLDRRNYAYQGRVKSFADGLREGGIKL